MEFPPEKWERVKDVLAAALEQEPEATPAFLDEVCSEGDIRREVERLLVYRSRAASFLSASALEQVAVPVLPPRLEQGKVLSSRFRIVRFIARGGMGEVYEAEDQELREKVAVKTIRQELMSQPRFLETFRREVHLARQVTHPNVCRIYDLFRHKDASGDSVFLSMELLIGETLAGRLERTGRMTTREALPIILQMADALTAAHVAGILHRDFKPGNVILVSSNRADGFRAVVTDFGLAFEPSDRDAGATLCISGGMPGTPAYMAPEQIEGLEFTMASDIYAFGLVIYEMVTGKTPFDNSNPLLAVAKRLHEPPTPPREFVPDLDRGLEAVIQQCLAPEPASRPQTVGEVMEAIRKTRCAGLLRTEHESAKWRTIAWTCAVSTILVVAIAGLLYHFHANQRRLTEKDTVVMADFSNKTADAVWDDTLKQGLREELEESPYLNILSDRKVTQLLRYMGRSTDERVTEGIAREVCQRAGSKAMLLGSISSISSHYIVGLQAVNCHSGDSLATLQVEANGEDDVLRKLHAVGKEMRVRLGESLASVEKYDTPVEQTTSSLEALQAYGAALRAKRSQGDLAALPLLKRAVELDQNFAMAYAVLAAVYSNLGDATLSAENARKAHDLRERVTERERFYIDSAYYNNATGELNREMEVYQQWKQTYPRDEVPYEKLAYCEGYLGQYEKALAGYREALQLEPNDVINYVDLAGTYINLNRLAEAEAVLNVVQSRKLEHEYVPQLYYLIAFMRDDHEEMEKRAQPESWLPGTEDILLSSLSDTEAFKGRLRNARKFSRQAIVSAHQNDATAGRAAFWQAHEALREAEFGNVDEARRLAAAALTLSSGEDVQTLAALALARAGDTSRAQSIVSGLSRRFPTNIWLDHYWLPSIRAAIEINSENPAGAIDVLELSRPYELGGDPIALDTLYPVYLRGQAYLMQHQGSAAAAEFQKILDHPGRAGNGLLGSLARLQLARAYALSSDTAKARNAYQHFLALWKDSDPDVYARRQAEIEFAKLH